MSPLQLRILDAARELLAVSGIEPTYRELAKYVGCSLSKAHDAVEALVGSGHLAKAAGPRGIRLVDRADLRAVPSDELRGELARRGETMGALTRRDDSFTGRGRPCAAECCGELVGRGRLFCRRHWFMLPTELRDTILRTFARRDQVGFERALTRARDLIDTGVERRA